MFQLIILFTLRFSLLKLFIYQNITITDFTRTVSVFFISRMVVYKPYEKQRNKQLKYLVILAVLKNSQTAL